MWECQVSVDIKAPVEQTTTGEIGVGTRFRAEEQVPRKYVSYCEITALEEPRLIAWKAWVGGVMRAEWEFRLSASAGGTRLVQVSRWEPAGPIGFLMLNLHRKRHVPRENQRTLNRISSLLEAEAAQPAAPQKNRATGIATEVKP